MPRRWELYGYGFNAHGQLSCDTKHDYNEFKHIASSLSKPKIIRASWAQTVFHDDNFITILGHDAARFQIPLTLTVKGATGDHDTTTHILTPPGVLVPLASFDRRKNGFSLPSTPAPAPVPPILEIAGADRQGIADVATTSAGRTCVVLLPQLERPNGIHDGGVDGVPKVPSITTATNIPTASLQILTFPDLNGLHTYLSAPLTTHTPTHPTLPLPLPLPLPLQTHPTTTTTINSPPPRHQPLTLLSYATGFILLLPSTGEVYTWGDARYPLSLGRAISPSPASSYPSSLPITPPPSPTQPGLVNPLGGLHISKIASCERGWIVGALTEAGDVFLWGGRGGEEGRWVAGLGEEVWDGYGDGGGGSCLCRVVLPCEGDGSGEEEEEEEEEEEVVEGEIVDVAIGVGRVLVLDGKGGVWMAEMLDGEGEVEGEGESKRHTAKQSQTWRKVDELAFQTRKEDELAFQTRKEDDVGDGDGDGDGGGGGRSREIRQVVGVVCGDGTAFAVVEIAGSEV